MHTTIPCGDREGLPCIALSSGDFDLDEPLSLAREVATQRLPGELHFWMTGTCFESDRTGLRRALDRVGATHQTAEMMGWCQRSANDAPHVHHPLLWTLLDVTPLLRFPLTTLQVVSEINRLPPLPPPDEILIDCQEARQAEKVSETMLDELALRLGNMGRPSILLTRFEKTTREYLQLESAVSKANTPWRLISR